MTDVAGLSLAPRAPGRRVGGVAHSRRLCVTAARFGLTLPEVGVGGGRGRGSRGDGASGRGGAEVEWSAAVGWAALAADVLLAPGESCLIGGPSGGGKTTLLRRFAGATPSRIVEVDAPRFCRVARSDRAVVDLFALPLDTTLRLLAAAGLAEAPLLIRAARDLSEGQRFRLQLALAMAEALRAGARGRAVTLIADEFCASLDSATAASVCIGLSRWLRATGVRLIFATARDDLRPWLRPHVIATTSLYEPPEVRHALRPHIDDSDIASS